MTLKQKLLSCLGLFAMVTVLIVGASYWSAKANEEALTSILQDRVVPMKDLKVTADSYAVRIVDAAHKARNGNFTFAQAAEQVQMGQTQLHEAWKRYRATKIEGEEEQLALDAETRMEFSDAEVIRLQAILAAQDRPALDRFVSLPQSILEKRESLEQLRALEDGMRIDAMIIDHVPRGVDTPPDLDRARAILEARAGA